MQRLFVLSLCAVVTTYAANAAADSPFLKGTYGFTGTSTCLFGPGGFDEKFQAKGGFFSQSFAIEGTRTFNGDGRGTVQQFGMSITLPPQLPTPNIPLFLPSASSSRSSVSFTYTVNGDGTFTVNGVPGTFEGTILTGPQAGQTFKLENVPTFTGLISGNGKTLTLAALSPGVETLISSNGNISQRICTLSQVLIKLDAD